MFVFGHRSYGSCESYRSQSLGFVEDLVDLSSSEPSSIISFYMYVFLITGSSLSSSKMSRCFCESPLDFDFVEEEECSLLTGVEG